MSEPNIHLHPDGLVHSPSYSHVVSSTRARTVFVSGQVALDAEGNTVGDDHASQTEQVMKNMATALAAAGATFADVAKITIFVVGLDASTRAAIGEVRSRYFTGDAPASTLVGVSALAYPGWLVEIEAIATLD